MSIGSQTTNLGLTVVDGPSGSLVLFLDWRLALDGLSSNMSIIDSWAGTINSQITTLQAQRGAIYVYATYSSGTLYTASVDSITSLSAGLIIDLVLSRSSGAGVTLNISYLGVKNVYKVNSVGTLTAIAVNDLVVGRHYMFYYDGTEWVWINATSSDQISINGSASMIPMITAGSGLVSSGISASTITLIGIDGWTTYTGSFVYVTASAITTSGCQVGIFQKGTKLKFTQTTIKYANVLSSDYVAPNTLIYIPVNKDYVVDNAVISNPYYSYSEYPQNWPDWFNYTPTYSAMSPMTYTSVVTEIAMYKINGRTVTVLIRCRGTTGGTATPIIYATIPISASITGDILPSGYGSIYDNANLTGQVLIGENLLNVRRYDGANWGLGTTRYLNVGAIYKMS